jgi:hypothetical protein
LRHHGKLAARRLPAMSDRASARTLLRPERKESTMSKRKGQKVSRERGTATRSKKNPGKRPRQGGS